MSLLLTSEMRTLMGCLDCGDDKRLEVTGSVDRLKGTA